METKRTGNGTGARISKCVWPSVQPTGNREFFGVDFVHSRMAERLHGPIGGAVCRGSSGDATANRVSEVSQVLFERRGAQSRLDHLRGKFGAGLFHRAGDGSLRHLRRKWRRLQRGHLRESGHSGEKQAGARMIRKWKVLRNAAAPGPKRQLNETEV